MASVPNAGSAAIATPSPADPAKSSTPTALEKALEERFPELSEEERKTFEALSCNGLDAYLEELKKACKKHAERNVVNNALDWFGPLFRAADLLQPLAGAVAGMHPAGALAMAGVLGVLQTTSRLDQYQSCTLQMLARMGRQASIISEYKTDLYQDDEELQALLVQAIGDILAFCRKGVRTFDDKGELKAKIRGLKLILFKTFESELGEHVQAFEATVEKLKGRAAICDKRRLKRILENLERQRKAHADAQTENRTLLEQQERRIKDEIEKISRRVAEDNDRHKKAKTKERLLSWLSSLSFVEPYDRRCRAHLEGTGQWLLNSEKYKRWKNDLKSDVLWVKGIPGCGKSVLAAVATTDLSVDPDVDTKLAYAFCRREDQAAQNPISIVGALSKQIGHDQPGIDSLLHAEFVASQRNKTPGLSSVRRIFKSVLSRAGKAYIVIDAIDECVDPDELLSLLLEPLEEQDLEPVKIIIFSRQESVVNGYLRGYPQIESHRENGNDLKAYVEYRFPDGPNPGEDNRLVRSRCIDKAGGMFQWVQLLAQHMKRRSMTQKEREDSVNEIPPGLDGVYDYIFDSIWNQDEAGRSTAFLVLLWVTHSKRPLTAWEMLEAVADMSECTTIQDLRMRRYPSAEGLELVCFNLVFIDHNDRVRLLHQTVRNYLDLPASKAKPPLLEYQRTKVNVDERLAKICLSYLHLEDFKDASATSFSALKAIVQDAPFLQYAAKWWGSHLPEILPAGLHELVKKWAESPPLRELSMQMTLYIRGHEEDLWRYSGTSHPMHALAVLGLSRLANEFLGNMRLNEDKDGSGRTPLEYSLLLQHHDMTLWIVEQLRPAPGLRIEEATRKQIIHLAANLGWASLLSSMLIDDRTHVNSLLENELWTPLVRVIYAGAIDCFTVLLQHGADVDLKDGAGTPPLIAAAERDNAEIVKKLLAEGADANCRDANGFFALYLTAGHNDVQAARDLLHHGADVKAKNTEGRTALHVAAYCQSTAAIKLLYEQHAPMSTQDNFGNTPLHLAAVENRSRSIELLLEYRTAKDVQNEHGRTPLLIAIEAGALEAAQTLISAGASVEIADEIGETPVHAAARGGHQAILQAMLAKRAFKGWKDLLEKPAANGETPLHVALHSNNNNATVNFLLRSGANVTTPGLRYSSPLHYAAMYGNTGVVQLLLDYGCDPRFQNQHGSTALHFAASSGKAEFISVYLSACKASGYDIDIGAQNKAGNTAFLSALIDGHRDLARMLLSKNEGCVTKRGLGGKYPMHIAAWHGLDWLVHQIFQYADSTGTSLEDVGLLSKDEEDRTPLFNAAARGHLSIVETLLPHSRDVLNDVTKFNKTPLCAAIANPNLAIANLLLDKGPNLSWMDQDENTILHYAAESGSTQLVERLLIAGCDGDRANRAGYTPFHIAVQASRVEVVDTFMSHNINHANTTITAGYTCVHIAASRGDLDMLHKLDEACNAKFGLFSLRGANAALCAAWGGHVEVLDFLGEQGEALDASDTEGYTPLMKAASLGYAETVRYLLERTSASINKHCKYRKTTATIEAAIHGYVKTLELLLEAGGDPNHFDVFGMNAHLYLSWHMSSHEQTSKPANLDKLAVNQVHLLSIRAYVRRCAEVLLRSPANASPAQDYNRLLRLYDLCRCLIALQDYEMAKFAFMGLQYPRPDHGLTFKSACKFCESGEQGDWYICKSCFPFMNLCATCHDDYVEAGYTLPEALITIRELEREVQPVRVSVSSYPDLYAVFTIVEYFKPAAQWVDETLEKYEAWEQKYNATEKYRLLGRPGQRFLELVLDFRQLAHRLTNSESTPEEEAEAFGRGQSAYESLRRKYRADRETSKLSCENHGYICISKTEREQGKTAGLYLESDSGRVTERYATELLQKYAIGSDSGRTFSQKADQRTMTVSRLASMRTPDSNNALAEAIIDSTPGRPSNLQKRSTSLELPLRLRGNVIPANTVIKQSEPPKQVSHARPRRAQTLPPSVDVLKLRLQNIFNAEDKDMHSLKHPESQLGLITGDRPTSPPTEATEGALDIDLGQSKPNARIPTVPQHHDSIAATKTFTIVRSTSNPQEFSDPAFTGELSTEPHLTTDYHCDKSSGPGNSMLGRDVLAPEQAIEKATEEELRHSKRMLSFNLIGKEGEPFEIYSAAIDVIDSIFPGWSNEWMESFL